MTPEERRKRMEERMAAMTPEERAAFEERMAQRAAQAVAAEASAAAQGQNQGGQRPSGNGQGSRHRQGGNQTPQARAPRIERGAGQGSARDGRLASAPALNTSATTIDSLFGPLADGRDRAASVWL